jgi:endonuclease/exonuclease/phosphatase family metal-dependent hydrolase
MASNTPCFQAEFFYGVPGAVPGFGFVHPELDRVAVMSYPAAAAAVERKIREEGHRGLLEGGSAWSDILSGGAAEAHFVSATAGLDMLLRALQPFRWVGLVLFHGWSVVRVAANLVAETSLALTDFVRGTLGGRHLLQELRFIPERLLVTAVLREIVTAGACVDADRGLPVVHLNLLGYDEHAHRRGPDSGFAAWTLRGLDRTVRRVWMAAHRSRNRDYQVWIYADHGQEPVTAYTRVHGEDVAHAILRVWDDEVERERTGPSPAPPPVERPERSGRPRWIAEELPDWMTKATPPPVDDVVQRAPEGEPQVVHMGPIGHVYLPGDPSTAQRDAFAARVAREAHVPMVLVTEGRGARVWTSDGLEHHLPEDAGRLFGEDHPHLDRVAADTVRLVHHEWAGDLTLLTWKRDGALSFKIENGAHGGPGPRETTSFLVVPPETTPRVRTDRAMRPSELRGLALHVLDPDRPHLPARPEDHRPRRSGNAVRLRIMTYNVHGCRGMDGRISVERVSRVIARVRPDIVCLQELDQSRSRSGRVDQAREIAERLETDYHFHGALRADDGRYGNAILCAHPVELVRSGSLPALATRLRLDERGALRVEVDVDGHRIQVVNTHLSILERERRLQVDALLDGDWLTDAKRPLLFAGDLNAAIDSYTGRRISERLRDVVGVRPPGERRLLRTWSGVVPLRRIDHVFASGHFRVLGIEVPRTRLTRAASDHLPLVVDLEWTPGRE